ncbi:MAG: lactate utilization protein [Bacteroidales bacterium]|nr:lactate utilization protein [Bacteroidales bacterium]
MNTDSYKDFLSLCKKAINTEKNVNISSEKIKNVSQGVFRNVDKVRTLASNIKSKFINDLSDNLVIFDKNFSENGGEIHWCVAYDDFLEKLYKLFEKQKIKKVNLFYSKFMEELGVEKSFEQKEIEIDRENKDCIVFSPSAGIVNTGSLFLNFTSSIDMEQVLASKLKIFILPINEFLFKPEEIEIFSHLYSIYKDEIDYPYLTSLYTPQPIGKENNVHLFIVDNGRSNILAYKEIRKALNCIGCDACKKVCPVFNIIGEKPYDNVFSGPYGNVVLPFVENIENYKHLPFSCTSCGNCSAICPISIPISDLITANKHYFFEKGFMDVSDIRLAKSLGRVLSSRSKMNQKVWKKNLKIKILLNNSKNISEKFTFSKTTFNQQQTNSKKNDE